MIEQLLCKNIADAIKSIYQTEVDLSSISLQKTRKEFEGDFTFAVFPYLKITKKSPEQTSNDIGQYLKDVLDEVNDFNVIKGFLNIVIKKSYWLSFLNQNINNKSFGFNPVKKSTPVMVEYSSPNTNKPLHLGHIRNNLLGWSVAEILKANGENVLKVNLVNDRGIHICKSMLAWKIWGNMETPQSSGLKGDHLAGKYYVLFDKNYKKEVEELVAKGYDKEVAEKQAPLMLEAQKMLRLWEAKDEDVLKLWNRMNAWVYEGFDVTYKTMGIDFDKTYYESNTYLLGKSIVEKGFNENKLIQKEDNSIWADLTGEGLDEKLLLRSDGTSVYMTQDLGTAHQRHEEYKPSKMIYVVGNEQNYHFDVLKLVLKKLGYDWSDSIYHLSYGMVELPEGKMKSREGTVVDADLLIAEMIETARQTAFELGKIDDFESEAAIKLYHTIALGALKYFILKVDPQKNMMFNPKESIDFNGNTGPFIQYTHARIKSLLNKADNVISNHVDVNINIVEKEKNLLQLIHEYPAVINQAAESLSPALISNYIYELAKEYNGFYQEIPIFKEENMELRDFRIALSYFVSNIIKSAMGLLGISVPDKM
ncbi:MAG: arginine--tRNA ligase [Bacteroidota bacterium]